MRYHVLNYDLTNHPQQSLINYIREEYLKSQQHLIEKTMAFKKQKDKEIREMDAPYIIALQHELKHLENRIIKEIKLHPQTYQQEILGGTRTRISEL